MAAWHTTSEYIGSQVYLTFNIFYDLKLLPDIESVGICHSANFQDISKSLNQKVEPRGNLHFIDSIAGCKEIGKLYYVRLGLDKRC
jgi:hypothetical protein